MNKWHEHLLWLIEDRKEMVEWLKKQLKDNPSDTATIPQPWASMTAREIKESIGIYK